MHKLKFFFILFLSSKTSACVENTSTSKQWQQIAARYDGRKYKYIHLVFQQLLLLLLLLLSPKSLLG